MGGSRERQEAAFVLLAALVAAALGIGTVMGYARLEKRIMRLENRPIIDLAPCVAERI